MRALSIFLTFFVLSCASGPMFHNGKYKVHFRVPDGWTALEKPDELRDFFKEAYSNDMAGAIVRNDRSAYIVIKSDLYPIEISGNELNDAIRNYLEAAFDKKRMVWDIEGYTYAIYDGAVLRGETLVASERWRDITDGVECDSVSHVLFYECGPRSCFTFVSLCSLPEVTESSVAVLEKVTEDLSKRL